MNKWLVRQTERPAESSLVLGTAQLGMQYGIANKTGQPNQEMANTIVSEAWKQGIREFDTAQGYGNSEIVLGKALSLLGKRNEARIITKLDPGLNHLDRSDMFDSLNGSLSRIGISSIHGVLIHMEDHLELWSEGLRDVMDDFVKSGKVQHVGVSVYSPEKALTAINMEGIDIIQLPTNIIDRRFEKAGVFKLASEKKRDVYIRSIFLQGLILMPLDLIPDKMAFVKPVIEKIELLSESLGMTRQEMALGYLKREIPEAKLVFGVETHDQIVEIEKCWRGSSPSSLVSMVKENFGDVDERILNPVLWPKG
jgi:aryl-alcohol dehydrogenase-like predicted oxidoreductase